jgi:hypothetical protein
VTKITIFAYFGPKIFGRVRRPCIFTSIFYMGKYGTAQFFFYILKNVLAVMLWSATIFFWGTCLVSGSGGSSGY